MGKRGWMLAIPGETSCWDEVTDILEKRFSLRMLLVARQSFTLLRTYTWETCHLQWSCVENTNMPISSLMHGKPQTQERRDSLHSRSIANRASLSSPLIWNTICRTAPGLSCVQLSATVPLNDKFHSFDDMRDHSVPVACSVMVLHECVIYPENTGWDQEAVQP